MSEQTIAEKLAAIAKNVPARSGGGSADTFVTIADITLEESVNTITIDESTFPDIAKVKDFYIAFEIAIPETEQSGNLIVRGIDSDINPILGIIGSWNHASYVMKGNFYSKWFEDNFRFNCCAEQLGANNLMSYGLCTTIYRVKKPLQGIRIYCQTATSQIPAGSKIKIGGYVGI